MKGGLFNPAIFTGLAHHGFVALKKDPKRLWGFGNNHCGQIGVGGEEVNTWGLKDEMNRGTDQQIVSSFKRRIAPEKKRQFRSIVPLKNINGSIKDVKVGMNFSLFLLSSGRVLSCGDLASHISGTGLLLDNQFLKGTPKLGKDRCFGEPVWASSGIPTKRFETNPRVIEAFENYYKIKIDVISTGKLSSFFVTPLKCGGKVFCCGGNSNGELGLGDTRDRPLPVENTSLPEPINQIASGSEFTYFFNTISGGIYATGSSRFYQICGIGGRGSITVPVKIKYFDENGIKLRKIYPGWFHVWFLTEKGRILVLGNNNNGKLKISQNSIQVTHSRPKKGELGTDNTRSTDPVMLEGIENVFSISLGEGFSTCVCKAPNKKPGGVKLNNRCYITGTPYFSSDQHEGDECCHRMAKLTVFDRSALNLNIIHVTSTYQASLWIDDKGRLLGAGSENSCALLKRGKSKPGHFDFVERAKLVEFVHTSSVNPEEIIVVADRRALTLNLEKKERLKYMLAMGNNLLFCYLCSPNVQ